MLQQYDPPLVVYGKPNNLFVADFVGSPSINFIEASGVQNAAGEMDFTLLGDHKAAFRFNSDLKMAEWRKQEAQTDADRAARRAALAKDKKHVEQGNKDQVFDYPIALVEGDRKKTPPTENDYVLGVRPEMIEICEAGGIEAEIYSAMPTGMETTVRLKVGNFLLTGVVFGGVTYEIGSRVRIRFKDNGVILFSRSSGRIIENGSLRLR